jgi:hypothetical protein
MVTILKSKKTRSKSRSKTKSRTKSKTHIRKSTESANHSFIESRPTTNITTNTLLKTCQELEVGDIGGFGSAVELEEHERRCSEQATEFCTSCGRNLCHNHYDLLHRDHDHSSQNSTISQL